MCVIDLHDSVVMYYLLLCRTAILINLRYNNDSRWYVRVSGINSETLRPRDTKLRAQGHLDPGDSVIALKSRT